VTGRTRRAGSFVAGLAVLAVLTDCSSSDGATAGNAAADPGAAAGAGAAGTAGSAGSDSKGGSAGEAAAPGSMCAMVPESQVESIYGQSFTSSGFLSGKACRYDTEGQTLAITVTQGGKNASGKVLEDLPALGEDAVLGEGLIPDADGNLDKNIQVPNDKGWLIIGVTPADHNFEAWRAKSIDLAKAAVKATTGR
jgi:hypothetical protein